MAAPADQRLERLLRASEAAGKVVVEAVVGPDGIRLKYAEPGRADVTPEDLIDWRPRARR